MKRLKNSVKAIIVAICALVVVAAAVVGVILVNRKPGGGDGNEGQKYVLTPAQKKLMNVINEENKKRSNTIYELNPYDNTSFVTEKGFSIDQTKITEIKGNFVKLSTDDGDLLYYQVTKNNKTYLVNLFDYLKTKNLISDTARKFVVENLYQDYFFYSYVYNDNELQKKAIEVCLINDKTLSNSDSIVLINKLVFDFNGNNILISENVIDTYSVDIDEDYGRYIVRLGEDLDEGYKMFLYIFNFTKSYVSNEDSYYFETIDDTYKILKIRTNDVLVYNKNILYSVPLTDTSDYSNFLNFGSDALMYSYSLFDDVVFVTQKNEGNDNKNLLYCSLSDKKIENVHIKNGFEYYSFDSIADSYFYICSKNSNDSYNYLIINSSFEPILEYNSESDYDYILQSDGKYIFTTSGLTISTAESVEAFVDSTKQETVVIESGHHLDNYYVFRIEVEGYNVARLNGTQVFDKFFETLYFIDENYALCADEEKLYKLNLSSGTYEEIQNADFEKTTQQIGYASLAKNGYFVIKENGKFCIKNLKNEIVSIEQNNAKTELSEITSISVSTYGRFNSLNLVSNKFNLFLYCFGNDVSNQSNQNQSEGESYSSGYNEIEPYWDGEGESHYIERNIGEEKAYSIQDGRPTKKGGHGSGDNIIYIKTYNYYYPTSFVLYTASWENKKITASFSSDSLHSGVASSCEYRYAGNGGDPNKGKVDNSKINSITASYNGSGFDITIDCSKDIRDIFNKSYVSCSKLYVSIFPYSRRTNAKYDSNGAYYLNTDAYTINDGNNKDTMFWYKDGTTKSVTYYEGETTNIVGARSIGYNSSGLFTGNEDDYIKVSKTDKGFKFQISDSDFDTEIKNYYLMVRKLCLIYAPNTYTFKISYANAMVLKTDGTNKTVDFIKDLDDTFSITDGKNADLESGKVFKYYSYDSDAEYKITKNDAIPNPTPSSSNYKFVGWAIAGGTRYDNSTAGYFENKNGTKTIYGGYFSITEESMQKLSTKHKDYVYLYPVFDYVDVSVRFNFTTYASGSNYYGIKKTESNGTVEYKTTLLNSSTSAAFSIAGAKGVKLKYENSTITNNGTSVSTWYCTKTNEDASFMVKYSPQKNIGELLTETSHAWSLLTSDTANTILTNSRCQINTATEWVVTGENPDRFNASDDQPIEKLRALTSGNSYKMKDYFKDHSGVREINFYVTYKPREYIFSTDTTTEYNGSALMNVKKYETISNKFSVADNIAKADLVNKTLEKCGFSITGSLKTYYMSSATFVVELPASTDDYNRMFNSTPRYMMDKIVLKRFGVYYDSKFQETTVTITLSGNTYSVSCDLGAGRVHKEADPDDKDKPWYYIGNKVDGVVTNKFRVTIPDVKKNKVIIEFQNVGIPGTIDGDNFTIDATTNKTGSNGIQIVPSAVTNNASPDNLYLSREDAGDEFFMNYTVTPVLTDSSNNSNYCVWVNNTKYSFVKTKKSGIYTLSSFSGTEGSFDGSKTLSNTQVYYDADARLMYVPIQKTSSSKQLFNGKYVYYSTDTGKIINYRNTNLIALRPKQSLMNYSDYANKGICSSYYELETYLSSISIGNLVINFDKINRYNGTSSYGNYMMVIDGEKPSGVDSVQAGNISNKIRYLGKEYAIHSYVKFSSSASAYDSTSRTFVLYLARNETTHEVMYFMYSNLHNDEIKTSTYTNIFDITFTFKSFNNTLDVNLTHESDDKFDSKDSPLVYRFGTLTGTEKNQEYNVAYQNSSASVLTQSSPYITASKFFNSNSSNSNYYYSETGKFYFNPNKFIILELQPMDGYLIKNITIKIDDKYVVLDNATLDLSTGHASQNNGFYVLSRSTTVGGSSELESLLNYKNGGSTFYKPFTASTFGDSYRNGVFITDKRESKIWKKVNASSHKFNSVYIMISGMYNNVSFDVTTTSFVEFSFNDSADNNLTTLSNTNVKTLADLNRLQMLISESNKDLVDSSKVWTNLADKVNQENFSIKTTNSVYSLSFFGCANLFKNGVRISATGKNYSSYFTNALMYADKSNIGFETLTYWYKNYNRYFNKFQFLGRQNTGETLFSDNSKYLTTKIGDAQKSKTANKNSYITYFEISDLKQFNRRSGLDTYSIFNIMQNIPENGSKFEYNNKYFFYCTVRKNNVEAQVNSYISNDEIKTTLNSTDKKLYSIINGDNDGIYRYLNNYEVYNRDRSDNNVGFQLDYVGALKGSDTAYRMKSNSWFNDVILSNIVFNYNGTTKNWQNLDSYKFDFAPYTLNEETGYYGFDSTSLGDNSRSIDGYNLMYTYTNIPGYYLQFIEIVTEDYGSIKIYSSIGDINKTGEIKKFFYNNKDYSEYKVGLSYSLLYDSGTGTYTLKLFDSDDDSILSKINSLGVLSNKIRVNFYSKAYTYKVNLYSNAKSTSTNRLLKLVDNNDVGVSNVSNQEDLTESQIITYDSETAILYRGELVGYTFVGWGSKNYYSGESLINRYDTTNNVWNSSSKWFRVTDYFDYKKRSDLIALGGKTLYSSDFYIKSSNYKIETGLFLTDTGYSGAKINSDQAKNVYKKYASSIENYNFWSVYAWLFTKYMNGDIETNVTYKAGNEINLYGIWKANVYSLKFSTNDYDVDSSISNGTTKSSLNIVSAKGSDEDAYSTYIRTHENYRDNFITTTFAGFNLSGDLTTTYYCFVTFDKNDWFITKSKTGSGISTYDSYYSYIKDTNGVASLYGGKNYLNMIIDRYGYSWLGWFSEKKTNALQNAEDKPTSNNMIFASNYMSKKYLNASGDTINVPVFDITTYFKFDWINKNEVYSEFIYYGEDVLVSGLKSNATNKYVVHYYYGNGATDNVNLTDGTLYSTSSAIRETRGGYTYNVAPDYLNTFSDNKSKLVGTSGVRASILTYFDTSLVYKDYVVQDNARVLIDRSNFNQSKYEYRSITVHAYWEVNSYQIIIDWQDTDENSFNKHGSSTAGIYRDSAVYDTIKVATSPDVGDFGKVTLSNAYFDDKDLSKRLSNFVPVREGYDFIGWTYYYYSNGEKANQPDLMSETYKIVSGGSTNEKSYTINEWLRDSSSFKHDGHIPIFQGYTDGLTRANELSSHFETYGDGENSHSIYIFALWKEQTFNVNVSLNISKENLENLYDLDSNFAVALYNSDDSNVYNGGFTAVKSSYYIRNNISFTEIVANLSFVVTFDGKFEDCYFDVKNNRDGAISKTRFYLKDLFAVSTGYYLIDWLYDSDDVNSVLVANTLKTIFGSGADDNYTCNNINSSGTTKIYTENGENGVFDLDFYRKVWVTNYNVNVSDGNIFNDGNKTLLKDVDTTKASSSFGYLTIGGNKYSILCEDVVDGTGNVTHYPYVKYAGIKYYILFYFVSSSENLVLSNDHENLYYNGKNGKGNSNGDRYMIRYNSGGQPYCVTSNYMDENIINFVGDMSIKIAMFTEVSSVSASNISNSSNLRDTTGFYDPTNKHVNINFTPFSTRQFTIYAHWQNKGDMNITINNLNNIGTSMSTNPGLAGFYKITNTGTHTKENTNYDPAFVHAENSNDANYIIDSDKLTSNENETNINLNFNYYDNLKLDFVPYFNGRYISSLKISWYGIEEVLENDSFNFKSKFKTVKYYIDYKFAYDNKTNSLYISGVSINGTNGYSFMTDTASGDGYRYIDLTYNYKKFSLLDQDSFTTGSYRFMQIYDFAENGTNSFDRIDVNKISMNMTNVMSNIEIDCKYSVQTYEIDVWTILDSEGNRLSIKEGYNNIYDTPFLTKDDMLANAEANTKEYRYKTSEKSDSRYFATIPEDCATYTEEGIRPTYNVPYGYFMYGIYYDAAYWPHRPIDETTGSVNVYDQIRSKGDYSMVEYNRYYGFDYLYTYGYYYYGTNRESDNRLMNPDTGEQNTYSSQCAPVLGSKSKFDASIWRTDLSFYSFGGWYEYSIDDLTGKVLFVEYNKLAEATYLRRNIRLYGYYYAINEPTSITFYVYDENNQKYVPYTGNQNEYTLNSNTQNSPYYYNESSVVALKEQQENFVDENLIAKFNIYNNYGVNGKQFNNDNIGSNEFNGTVEDNAMLAKLLRTYWYYEDSYDVLYLLDGENNKHYIRYDETKSSFYYLTNEDDESSKYYVTVTTSDYSNFRLGHNNAQLHSEIIYKYDFPGSKMFLKVPKSGHYDKDFYYEFKKITSSDEYTTSWLASARPRYYTEIENVKYYIFPRNPQTGAASKLIYNADGNADHGSDNRINNVGTEIVNIDFYEIIYQDEYYKVSYLQGYDDGGSLYINPYYNAKENKTQFVVDGVMTDFYFDYENEILYYALTERMIDYEFARIYCSVNDNYSITARINGETWNVSGINIKSLPSPNISYWYGDEQYGFVGYIALTDKIFEGFKKADKDNESGGSNIEGGKIYTAFANYIDTIYADRTDEYRKTVKNAVGGRIGDYTKEDLLTSFLIADSYELNTDEEDVKNGRKPVRIKYINVNVPVRFEDLYIEETGEYLSLSIVFEYKFNIVSTETEVIQNIYAIPIYSPYVMEFNTDSVTKTDKKVTVDVEQMNVWHFELSSSSSAHIYSPASNDYLNLIVLSYEQFEELKQNNINIADYLTKMRKQGKYIDIKTQTLTESKLEFDFSEYDDGHYFVFAYYNKTGITDEDSAYVTRVSDNFIHINKDSSGLTNEISTFSTFKIE